MVFSAIVFLVSLTHHSIVAVAESHSLKERLDILATVFGKHSVAFSNKELLRHAMDHDISFGISETQSSLICSDYEKSQKLALDLTSQLRSIDYHPVHYSVESNKACFMISASSDLTTFRNLPYETILTRIPVALKLNPSMFDLIATMSKGDSFVLEVFMGLGVNGKGIVDSKKAYSMIDEAMSTLEVDKSRSEHFSRFFFTTDAVTRSKTTLNPITEYFMSALQQKDSCKNKEFSVEISRVMWSVRATGHAGAHCLILAASVLALRPDVSYILAHQGYQATGHVVADAVASEPYTGATPATDQNAWVQSGNSVDTPYSSVGINGSSYVVGIIDTGVDDLSCFAIDYSGTPTTRTPASDYANPITEPWRRKVIQYIAYADGTNAEEYDHGTWVMGASTGQCINLTSSASAYNGVAPSAKITMFDVDITSTGAYYVPPLYSIALPPSYSAGARTHSNSWGCPRMNSYTGQALDVDDFTYDNPDFLFIVAAMNDGSSGYGSVGSPGLAKNALTVGATSINHDELADFSSIGPTPDGRIKPDVVAPGVYLMSAGVRNSPETESCNVQISSGTSMATPIVAGAAVLVRNYMEKSEYWGQYCDASYKSCPVVNPSKGSHHISAALLKAILIHSGESIDTYNAHGSVPGGSLTTPPDVIQGWGQVLLKNALPIPGVYDFDLYVSDYQSISSFYAHYVYVTVTDATVPLRATLSWTDPANVVWAAKNLLNDLDLMIVSPTGVYYYGNNIKGDELNPVERVVLSESDGLAMGTYTVIVVAKSLATGTQDFSIVITSGGSVDETKTRTSSANLNTQLFYENATETCEGTYSNPTGNILVRFQLEDWQQGSSWVGLDFEIIDSNGVLVSSCTYNQNIDNDFASYTRMSQCSMCLPDNSEYVAQFNTSAASNSGSDLIRVATTQCDNIFLSSLQESAKFSLSKGLCNNCPSGSSHVYAYMTANVTDDDFSDYSWYGLAHWTMEASNDVSGTPAAAGTLLISDASADRYCLPDGTYNIVLDDAQLYETYFRHATITFSTGSTNNVTLSGYTGTLTGAITLKSVSPTPTPEDSSNDDGWSSLDSFGNLAILLVTICCLIAAVAIIFVFMYPGLLNKINPFSSASEKEPLMYERF